MEKDEFSPLKIREEIEKVANLDLRTGLDKFDPKNAKIKERIRRQDLSLVIAELPDDAITECEFYQDCDEIADYLLAIVGEVSSDDRITFLCREHKNVLREEFTRLSKSKLRKRNQDAS